MTGNTFAKRIWYVLKTETGALFSSPFEMKKKIDYSFDFKILDCGLGEMRRHFGYPVTR